SAWITASPCASCSIPDTASTSASCASSSGTESPCSVELQQPRGIAAHHLVALIRRHADLIHHLKTLHLERDQRRRIGAEDEMLGAHGLETHFGGERGVARGIEIHHLEVMAGRVLDQHRLVAAEEIGKLLQLVGVV